MPNNERERERTQKIIMKGGKTKKNNKTGGRTLTERQIEQEYEGRAKRKNKRSNNEVRK